jgi:ferric-dicitrate binding protein FerR (iron transport regulator)
MLTELKQMIAADKAVGTGTTEILEKSDRTDGIMGAIGMEKDKESHGFAWRRYAVAACMVLLLGYGAYHLFIQPSPKPEIAQKESAVRSEKKEVLPGGNRAILTLANGTAIVLDSAGNGELARQGSTRIVKLDNGQLAYHTKGNQDAEVMYNTMTTPRGGQYKLILPDGTAVWLNAASSIRYPTAFTGKQRQVDITGEAYFEVAPDKAMPFIVMVNKTQKIEVLGTHFNVNAYDDETSINTTLLEGSVKVVQGDRDRILAPGQQAQVDKKGGFSVIPNANTEAAVAWKNGVFLFDHSNVQSVMRQLARWFDMEVEYRGQPTSDLFGGDIRRSLPLTKVFHFLEKSQVHFSIEGKKIIVMP